MESQPDCVDDCEELLHRFSPLSAVLARLVLARLVPASWISGTFVYAWRPVATSDSSVWGVTSLCKVVTSFAWVKVASEYVKIYITANFEENIRKCLFGGVWLSLSGVF